MNLIHTTTLEYPRSLWQLRQENPNVSFPADPTDEDLAPFDHACIHPSPQPEHSPRAERLEEGVPAQDEDGIWRQTWTVRQATEEEIAAYDIAHAPAPDWSGFAVALIFDPSIRDWYNDLPQALASGLSIGLYEVTKSNPGMFLRLWAELAPFIPAQLPPALAALAEQHHLPADFIGALSVAPAAP